MQIGHHTVSDKVLVVAEIGNNHEGKLEVARELVRRAAECKVDAVKFQTFRTRNFVSASDPQRYKRLSGFELTFKEFHELEKLAHALGLLFISTPLDLESARFLEPLVDAFKIASGDNDFWALIDFVARADKPVIVSSGMADLPDLIRVRDFVRERQRERHREDSLAILHCVSSYPAPPEQANLNAIPLMRETLGCTIGYSDHTIGIEASLAAVSLGARIIEKHFTLDKHFSDFRDHLLSADPEEMLEIVERVRRIEVLLGKREKAVQTCEVPIAAVARRSIAAGADLPEGHMLALGDLTWLRPSGGLRPGQEQELVGKRLKRRIEFGETIALADLE
jgi:sialic acid synthase SpsE